MAGYLISCIATSVQMAMAFGPTFLIPLMLFGGVFLNNTTIPVSFRYIRKRFQTDIIVQVYLNWIKYISWFMYSNEALLINNWRGVVVEVI